MFKGIDLSSDTATKPSKAMLEAMMLAQVGDEQQQEDPTTLELERFVANLSGFSCALFFPSATMANQVAIRALSEPGDELLAAANCHLFHAEAGGPAVHANVMCKPIPTTTGIFTSDDIKKAFHWSKGVNYPLSKLISIENTSNLGGGTAWTKNQLSDVLQCANELGLKKHMDGARIFNASICTGSLVKEIASGFDTLTICLSKGLGCPMGALLAFDLHLEKKIRRLKHLMGGAMRQSGIVAAAGLYALKNNVNRLTEDHENAKYFAAELIKIPKIEVITNPPETNFIFLKTSSNDMSCNDFKEKCLEKGVRFSQINKDTLRAVTHLDISNEDIKKAVGIIAEVLA